MEPQALDPEFRAFLKQFYNKDGTRPHDKVSGQCKCGEVHQADEFARLAAREYQAQSKIKS